ncbi:MAG: hypothetical protein COC06_07645 [Bacteroidales bacterium]|nr:MAG: hypothetical protein COC06_07645 [Bacteroidales bacterium]
MAYNRKNHLINVLFVQEFYKEQNKKGVPNTKIVENLQAHNIHISLATFYNYMQIPAKRDLKRIEQIRQQQEVLF